MNAPHPNRRPIAGRGSADRSVLVAESAEPEHAGVFRPIRLPRPNRDLEFLRSTHCSHVLPRPAEPTFS